MTANPTDVLDASWNYPTSVRVGAGCVNELADHCAAHGIRAPLLVTDPGLASLPMTTAIVAALQDVLQVRVFSDVKSNPSGENVTAGAAAYRESEHDGVIALGGGSALDAGKAIALLAGQSGPLFDYADEPGAAPIDAGGIARVIAIPTTAGTGSEVGRASVITDTQQQRKRIIFHPKMLPVQVLLDPALTVGLPPHITAATGMDALSHNLEALCANAYHPMAAGIALEGIRLVRDYLPRAVADGTDIEARTHMLVASSMGATAFQRGLGAMHALSHPLGALYDAHHGLLNAIVMPYVLVANRAAIEPTLDDAARSLDLPGHNYTGFVDWVLHMRESLGIPHTLAQIGINADEAQRVGEMAAADSTAPGNPVPFTPAQYARLFTQAVTGSL